MSDFAPDAHVGTIAREWPATIAVFQRHGIDFCCGGKRPLAEVTARAGLSFATLVAELREAAATPSPLADWSEAPLPALVDHIVERYHQPLRRDLPVLLQLAAKVAQRHGAQVPALLAVREACEALAGEMLPHLEKEELVLFPFIVRLANGADDPAGLPIAGPVAAMEAEHREVAQILGRLRVLTGGYQAPEGACNSFRGLFQMLATLEADTHDHIHLENNVLFARATAALARPAVS
jgi:regulator of cell morphogenesis and NO signaling